nr:hypothetical protein [Pseudoalteromonas sp. BMB]
MSSRRKEAQKPHISINGKVLRGCWKDKVYNALNVVGAFDADNGLALYQQAAQNKCQKGQISRDIIDILACKGCILTLDALHCRAKRRGATWNSDFRTELLFG